MGILYRGNTKFDLCEEPKRSKNEWGVDVVTLVYSGRKPLLEAFWATLKQGKAFLSRYYLQTWEEDGGQVFPKVTLTCKGFLSGSIPTEDGRNSFTTKTAGIGATIENEDVAELIKGEAISGDETSTVTATRDVTFYCPQTEWHYLTSGKPDNSKFSSLNFKGEPVIIRSRILAKWKDHEKEFRGNAPAALVTATTLATVTAVESFTANQIFGTPYWECTDVVTRSFVGD